MSTTRPVRSRPLLAIAVLIAMLAAIAGPAAGVSTSATRLPVAGDLPDAACASGAPLSVAQQLLDPAAELVEIADDSALVLTSGVHPGVRARLLAVGVDSWCAASAVNAVAALRGLTDAVDIASLAATVLPAANFDAITVTDAALVAPGVVSLSTHALTNGVTADWTITVDAAGVRRAEWTATGFAVAPLEAEIEGLTALPGATWAYERTASGLVEPTTTIEALAAAEAEQDPSPFISYTNADDFTVHVSVGDAQFYPQVVGGPGVYGGLAPDAGTDTGNEQVDYLRIIGEGIEVNMDDFYDWGFRKGWVDDEGTVYVDGALSAYCLACVLVSEYFNVHMNRAAHEAIGALGYTYPDTRLAIIDIVGHEIVHNYQNAYGKPSSVGGGRHNSYSEGMARFSETLHSYSEVSLQPGSLVYANDTNGCNGWQGSNADAAFAAGPLTGQSYDACYFWMTVHAAYGIEAFTAILESSVDLPSGRPWQIYGEAIATATGDDLESVLANFAAMTLTGRDYRWGAPADPEAPVLDWATHLDRWTPASDIAAGGTFSRTLRDGGMAAAQVLEDGVVEVSEGEGQAVVLVVDDGVGTTTTFLADGDTVSLDGAADAWLVLINAATDNAEVSVSLT